MATDTGSVEKTAFRVPFGLYEFTRMSFRPGQRSGNISEGHGNVHRGYEFVRVTHISR